jgi:polyhydroxyalkanoate synthase subunit PhaE
MHDNQDQSQSFQTLFGEWIKQSQSQWMSLGKFHNSTPSESEEETVCDGEKDQCLDLWSKTLQQIFNMPQIGLTRIYQEKVNHANEKYCRFQAAVGSFCLMLSMPLERAYQQLQEQLTQSAKQETLPEDAKYYYDTWIKILESQYHELLNSTDYIQTLAGTLDSMNAFVGAREAVITDALKVLPIPSNTDMDALYREIYQLKKRIKTIEKTIAPRKIPIYRNAPAEA